MESHVALIAIKQIDSGFQVIASMPGLINDMPKMIMDRQRALLRKAQLNHPGDIFIASFQLELIGESIPTIYNNTFSIGVGTVESRTHMQLVQELNN
jgi:hypothetical protein